MVDLDTGAILATPVHPANVADTASLSTSLEAARENVHAAVEISRSLERARDDDDRDDAPPPSGTVEPDDRRPPAVDVVCDKGYHSIANIKRLEEEGFRSYVPERKQKGRRRWDDKGGPEVVEAFYRNRARVQGKRSKRLHRRRGEIVERTFAHICETGGGRRTRLRGMENVEKRYKFQAAAFNLALVMRSLFRVGTPRGFHDARRSARRAGALLLAIATFWAAALRTVFSPGAARAPGTSRGLRCYWAAYRTVERTLLNLQPALSSTGC